MQPDDKNPVKQVRTFREHIDEDGNSILRATRSEILRLIDGGDGVDRVVTYFASPYYRCGCPYTYRDYCPEHEYVGSAPWNVAARLWKGRRRAQANAPDASDKPRK